MALIDCQECSSPISDKAKACPQCGAPREGASDEKWELASQPTKEDLQGFLSFQMLAISIAAGFISGSWLVFGGVFVGLVCLITLPGVRYIIGLFLALAFGFSVFFLVRWSWGQEAGGVLGGLAFIVALASNHGALEQFRDAGED